MQEIHETSLDALIHIHEIAYLLNRCACVLGLSVVNIIDHFLDAVVYVGYGVDHGDNVIVVCDVRRYLTVRLHSPRT